MPEVRGQAPKRHLEPLLERCVAHVGAQLSAVSGPLERVTERAEPGDHALIGVVLGFGSGPRGGFFFRAGSHQIFIRADSSFGFRLLPGFRLRRSQLRRLAFRFHETGSKRALGLVLIMRATTKPQAVHRRLAASYHRVHVISLEPAARLAAPPVLAHEAAPPAVALPDSTPDLGGDVAGVPRASPGARPGAPIGTAHG